MGEPETIELIYMFISSEKKMIEGWTRLGCTIWKEQTLDTQGKIPKDLQHFFCKSFTYHIDDSLLGLQSVQLPVQLNFKHIGSIWNEILIWKRLHHPYLFSVKYTKLFMGQGSAFNLVCHFCYSVYM